jgi:hypothetical protein
MGRVPYGTYVCAHVRSRAAHAFFLCGGDGGGNGDGDGDGCGDGDGGGDCDGDGGGDASAKCKSVRKSHANLPDTPVYPTSASKYFQMLLGPPGAE